MFLALGLSLASTEGRAADGDPGTGSRQRLTASAASAAKKAARRDATAMGEAFLRGDLERFASYTDPGLLKMFGGKQKLIATIEAGLPKMAAGGISLKSTEIGEVTQFVEAEGQLQATLPRDQLMTMPGGEVHLLGYLIGVSRDGGKTWTFMDAEKVTPENVRMVLPTYDPRLKLPGRVEPRFVPKQRQTGK